MNAVVIGGSGTVGKHLVEQLAASPAYQRILLVGRRTIELKESGSKVSQTVVDMDKMKEAVLPMLREHQYDVAYCTMGVGAPSKVSKDELERVDYTIPAQFAAACRESGVKHFSLLTAIGANADSKYCAVTRTAAGGGWYRNVKGRIENDVQGLGFAHVHIFRAGTLLGNPNTPGFVEWLAPKLGSVVPNKYREIHVRDLATAMIRSVEVHTEEGGVTIHEGGDISKLLPSNEK